jgi:ketosteroid isomerase-like protein
MTHAETVQGMYAAFQRGDLAAIFGCLAEDVVWEYGIETPGVPWLAHRRGRHEVPGFFASMAHFELIRFEPKALLAHDDVVVALIDVEITVKATGHRLVEADEVHIWRFNSEGRVASFAHKVDTYQHWRACGGAA